MLVSKSYFQILRNNKNDIVYKHIIQHMLIECFSHLYDQGITHSVSFYDQESDYCMQLFAEH